MPPATLWTGNPNQKISIQQGNIAYDDPNTTYDQTSTYYNGAPPQDLSQNYQPKPIVWTQENPS